MTRRIAVLALAVLLGCDKSDASKVEYVSRYGVSDTLRVQVRTDSNGNIILLTRVVSGAEVASSVVTLDGCSVFSSESWTCRAGDEIIGVNTWTLDSGTLAYSGRGPVGNFISLTLRRVTQ